jgi:hypothetical protein
LKARVQAHGRLDFEAPFLFLKMTKNADFLSKKPPVNNLGIRANILSSQVMSASPKKVAQGNGRALEFWSFQYREQKTAFA